MRKVTATGLALVLMTSSSAIAQTAQYDSKIAKAAADRVAEKMGDIRPSIDKNQKPAMVTREDLKKKKVNTSYLPDNSKAFEQKLSPVSSNRNVPEIDYTVTGSISRTSRPASPRVVWERFDRYGNPIEVK